MRQIPAGTGERQWKEQEVDDEEEYEVEDVGGITECWSISEVDEWPGWWRRVQSRKEIRLANRFAALAEVGEVTEEDGHMDQNCVVNAAGYRKLDCVLGQSCVMDGNCVAGMMDHGKPDYADGGGDHTGQYTQAVVEGGHAGHGEIVIDSGAAESVCPWDWAEAFPIKAVLPEHERHFRNASGGKMTHYGEKRVRGSVAGMEAPISMLFQVSDAKNALASVARITEKGNLVQFGPEDSDNFIVNPRSRDKVMLRRKGNKFVLDMDFFGRA